MNNRPASTRRTRRLTLEALESRDTPAANVVAQTGAADPFASAGSVFTPAPALGDLDGDGDLDAVIGMSNGTFAYLQNTGTASAPNFVAQTGAANPFNGFDVGNFADATLGDLDGDGDLDLLAGATSGTILYFRNTGTAAAPAFTEQTGAANPFAGVTGDSYAFPALGDSDGDGKTDLLIGTEFSGAAFYRNTGTLAAPVFTPQTGSANPFNGVNPGSSVQPALGDLDADGDLDTVLGYFSAGVWRLTFYRTNQSPVLTGLSASVTYAENTVNAGAQGLDSGVTVSDADGGNFRGGSLAVDNTGTGQEGVGIGTGFGNGITVSRTSVLFSGNTIGTVPSSGAGSGLAGNDLVVSFTTAFATPAAVEALIESLTYRNTSDAPVAARTLSVTVNDGAGGTGAASIIVNVTADNDAPTFTSTPATAATEDAVYSYAVTVADPDAPAQNLTVIGTTVPAWLTLNVTGNGTPAASATLTGTPTNADVGDHTVTLAVSDGITSADQTFTITVVAVNDAPSVTLPASITVVEDTPLVLTGISVADPDAGGGNVTLTLAVDAGALSATAGEGVAVGNTPVTLTLTGTPAALNAFLAAGGVTYTPGAAAVATLSVTADDGGNTGGGGGALQSPAATAAVAVTAVNDAPGFAAGPDQSTTASPAPRAVAGWATGITAGPADEAGQTLAFEVTVDRPGLFAVPPAVDPASGALTYTPAPGATGTATVTVRLRDSGGTASGGQDVSAAQAFTITLTPVPPRVAVGGSASGAVSVFNADGTAAFSVPSGGAGGAPRVATGDVTGDGVADLVVGTGSGGVAGFRVIDGATRAPVRTAQAFEAAFTGGVFLAVGDVDGDGFADVAVSADATGGGRVTVFGGRDGAVLANFFGIGDPDFRGGARVAFGDVNGDGTPDLVVAAGPGGGPRVAVFDGRTLAPGATPARLVNDFFALDPALRDGVYVAAGDINGDGFAEVIAAAGQGGAPRVFAADGRSLATDGSGVLLPRANFFATDSGLRTGARVAAHDFDGDGRADLAVGLATTAGPVVRLYLGRDVTAGGTPPVYRELTDLGGDLQGVFVG